MFEAVFFYSGSDAGNYFLDLKNGSGACGPGTPPQGDADVTFTLKDNDFHDMFDGRSSFFSNADTPHIWLDIFVIRQVEAGQRVHDGQAQASGRHGQSHEAGQAHVTDEEGVPHLQQQQLPLR